MIRILPLEPEYAGEAVALIAGDPEDYRVHFSGLPATAEEFGQVLEALVRDGYWMVRVKGEMAGIFMLRGWDAGYAVPAFGVYVAQRFAGAGLARLAMDYALCYCRLLGQPEIMLTVHPDNQVARSLYERMGFQARAGEVSPKGHLILRKPLNRS